ncbi:MAG TPA: phasin family protein [Xanthobacteraceae bacterium]|nr:phasin family protein [Xanthobacteraceae bacterium]
MDQPQAVKPAGVSRPTRRSLTEFALQETGLVEELPAATPALPAPQAAATAQRSQSSPSSDRERHHAVHAPPNQHLDTDATGSTHKSAPEPAEAEDALLHQLEDMTSAATTMAKDYRFLMLEHMKINMTAALGYMSGLAVANSRITSAAHSASTQETSQHPHSAEEPVPTDDKTVQEYRVKALELMTANMNTTLEYAQRLAHVKTPTEFIELATNQARKQFDLMVQTGELGSIAQRLAPHDIASMTSSFTKLFCEPEE